MRHKYQDNTKKHPLYADLFSKLVAVFCFTMLSTVSLNTPPASAASVYDDALATVSQLRYGSYSPTNNYQDVTDTYTSFFSGCAPSYLTSFQTAVASGYWRVVQQIGTYSLGGGSYEHIYAVEITWSDNGNGEVVFHEPNTNYPYGAVGLIDDYAATNQKRLIASFNWFTGEPVIYCYNYATYDMSIPVNVDPVWAPEGYSLALFANTYPVTYPDDYEGGLVPMPNVNADNDEDGLTLIQEMQQGTLDNNTDTDGDGISDLKESIWFEDRDEVFCDTTASPYACAYPDPTTQDLYVEMDWMYNPIESRSFMPTNLQLEKIEDAFDAQGIKFHADTGQFGGGNELPSYESALYTGSSALHTDFADFKLGYDSYPANYNANREGIWHYMISGYGYAEVPTSSGIAEVGGSDIFISNGLIEDTFTYADFDDAIAGTMIHEIGHNLCLSDALLYVDQPAECVHGGVDADKDSLAYIFYPSAMTYRYQFDTVDYSDGSHGLNDHDDWSAVKVGLAEFTKTHTPLSSPGRSSERERLAFDMNLAAPNEMTPEQSKELYEEKQKEDTISEDEKNTQTEPADTSNSEQPSGFDSKLTAPNKLTPEESKELYQSHQIAAWLPPLAAMVVALGLVVAAILSVRRRKVRKSRKISRN